MPNRYSGNLVCLLLLAVFLLAPMVVMGSGQIVDPSHPRDRSHMGQTLDRPECGICHLCEMPTKDDPCLLACPRHESHFYGQYQVSDGPDVILIDQLANLYKPVVFAHRLHAEMSEMTGGCENCHHYSYAEEYPTIPPCRECHDPASNPVDLSRPHLKGAYHRQCINCHRDWSNENSCGFCHEQADVTFATSEPDTTDIMGIPHPAITARPTYIYETTYRQGPLVSFHHEDHVEMFGQACVDCHRGDSCARCHDEAQAQTPRIDHVTTCCSCHGERDCGFCHSDKITPRFQHALTTGWDLEPYHSRLECNDCHRSPETFRHPSSKCVSCHIHWESGSFNHRVTGLTLSEDHLDLDCTDCHKEMDFTRNPNCEDCHDEAMFPQELPGVRRR